MTTATMALIEYLRKMELEPDDDWLREMVQQFTQGLIELEAEQKIGAAWHEHSPKRQAQRNGYRERGLATRVGDLELRTPALAAQASCRGDTRTHENEAYSSASGWCEVDAHWCQEPEAQADPTT